MNQLHKLSLIYTIITFSSIQKSGYISLITQILLSSLYFQNIAIFSI